LAFYPLFFLTIDVLQCLRVVLGCIFSVRTIKIYIQKVLMSSKKYRMSKNIMAMSIVNCVLAFSVRPLPPLGHALAHAPAVIPQAVALALGRGAYHGGSHGASGRSGCSVLASTISASWILPASCLRGA
jgi:hypothetical protein